MRMPLDRCRTVADAKEYAKWRALVREEFRHMYIRFHEGSKVQTLDGEVGRVTSYSYFPDNDNYAIEVVIGSRVTYFSDPYDLELIHEEPVHIILEEDDV